MYSGVARVLHLFSASSDENVSKDLKNIAAGWCWLDFFGQKSPASRFASLGELIVHKKSSYAPRFWFLVIFSRWNALCCCVTFLCPSDLKKACYVGRWICMYICTLLTTMKPYHQAVDH